MQNCILRTFNTDIIKDVEKIRIYVWSNKISIMRINHIFYIANIPYLSRTLYISLP